MRLDPEQHSRGSDPAQDLQGDSDPNRNIRLNNDDRHYPENREDLGLSAYTHLTEIVARVGSRAQLSVELVKIAAVELENLSAVQAELVRGRGDVVLALELTRLRKVWQFLANWREPWGTLLATTN